MIKAYLVAIFAITVIGLSTFYAMDLLTILVSP